jgi:5-methylcytosine-specific restriction endonuclease McrA
MRYCVYCGRMAHRCQCADENSRLQQFFARRPSKYQALWMNKPYKRAVPPQIKQKERAILRKNYTPWFTELVETDGEKCANCGISSAEAKLVLDHIISIAKGGKSERSNLQILCAECNRIKGKLCIDCRKNF